MHLVERSKQLLLATGSEWVLWILVGLSAASLAVIVERVVALRRLRGETDDLRAVLASALKGGGLARARDAMGGLVHPAAKVALRGMRAAENETDPKEAEGAMNAGRSRRSAASSAVSKTALVRALCRALREELSLGVVTKDIFTGENAEFLTRNDALPPQRVRAVETGGCPHAAIREDISPNLGALEDLMRDVCPELLLVESGGDNLAAQYSRELVDYTVYVIDVAGGDKVPRKGGPGITQSDLLIINKTDLAPHVGADLSVMDRDAKKMRGDGPTVFASFRQGEGLPVIRAHLVAAYRAATRPALFRTAGPAPAAPSPRRPAVTQTRDASEQRDRAGGRLGKRQPRA